MAEEQKPDTTKENEDDTFWDNLLDRLLSPVAVLFVLVAAVGFYYCQFHELGLSEDPAKWGPFGDYVGGLLNPMIALAALWWLRRSYKVQKKELKETREALEDQLANQRKIARLESINMELSAFEAELAFYRNALNDISVMERDHTGASTYMNPVSGELVNKGDNAAKEQCLEMIFDMMRSTRDHKANCVQAAKAIDPEYGAFLEKVK